MAYPSVIFVCCLLFVGRGVPFFVRCVCFFLFVCFVARCSLLVVGWWLLVEFLLLLLVVCCLM